ncbi:MAG: PRC-barrel domain-containing protein [Ktedonobacterales bacterium]
MSDATAQQSSQAHTIVENIDQYLFDGMPVHDANGERIGTVKMYSVVAGYLMVGTGPLGKTNLYIPFRLIRTIDPRELYLNASRGTLEAQYTQPPEITTVSEMRLAYGPHGAMTPQTVQVQTVQSGYDGKQMTVSSIDVGTIAQQLVIGMAVYDGAGARLGEITQYDLPRGLLVVESGIFKPRVLFVPFSAIQSADRDTLTVYLRLPKDVIVKEHAMLPAGD